MVYFKSMHLMLNVKAVAVACMMMEPSGTFLIFRILKILFFLLKILDQE